MAYGGGSFVTQNKVLPGAYANVVTAEKATATLGERGFAAIALPIRAETAGKVITITNVEYLQTPEKFLGDNIPAESEIALDELFKHALTAYIFDTYSGEAAKAVITMTLDGSITTTGIEITGGTTTITQLGDTAIGASDFKTLFDLTINSESKDWVSNGSDVIPAGATIGLTAKTEGHLDSAVLTSLQSIGAVKDSVITDGHPTIEKPDVGKICMGLEPYDFNCLAAYAETGEDVTKYISQIKIWRDQYGKKCQLVVYNESKPDYEGVINIANTVTDAGAPAYALVPWVCGVEAACGVNESVQNTAYDGVYTINTEYSQTGLEDMLNKGMFVFHRAYDDVVVLDDINSLVTTTVDKGEDLKSNQVIRVVDQIANDIAKLFNTKYLGKIPNDNSGRISLWADIVKHHNNLQDLRAIEDFESEDVVVSEGETKKNVVVFDAITPVVAMSKLYMTIYVQ